MFFDKAEFILKSYEILWNPMKSYEILWNAGTGNPQNQQGGWLEEAEGAQRFEGFSLRVTWSISWDETDI